MLNVGGLKVNDYVHLMGSSNQNKSTKKEALSLFFQNIKIFFYRLGFLFKTLHWENNHRLIHRIDHHWKHIEISTLKSGERSSQLKAVDNLVKMLLIRTDSFKDKILLRKINRELNDLYGKEIADEIFFEELFLGVGPLLKKGIEKGCNRPKFNYLLYKLFFNKSGMSIIFNFSTKKKFVYDLRQNSNKEHTDTLILPIAISGEKQGKYWADCIQKINQQRLEEAKPPFTRIFQPLIVPGRIDHGILVVAELDPSNDSKANISIIDPFGDKSGYKKREDAFVKDFQSGFLESTVVFNKIKQQTDALTCGFHQILNIRDLLNVSNIQEHVKKGKLPVRSTDTIRTFIHNLNPEMKDDLNALQKEVSK